MDGLINAFISGAIGSGIALYTGAFGTITAVTDFGALIPASMVIGGFVAVADIIVKEILK